MSGEETTSREPSGEQTLAATRAPTSEYEADESSLTQRLRRGLSDAAASRPQVGRFEILRELGRGGMGSVYVGRDARLDREVAIKLVRNDRLSDDTRRRLETEAQVLARLSHPNVVPVFEVGEEEGETFLAMELIVGRDIRTWLQQQSRTWSEIVDVFTQAARGLSAAHAQGLVHRDFKPHNALVGDDGRVRVVDFGIASEDIASVGGALEGNVDLPDATVSVTRTGGFLGTPAYMSPEQIAGRRVGPASDQFSLCVSMFEALAGRRPFGEGTVQEVAARVLEGQPEALPPGEYPESLGELIGRGLQKEPVDRFADMDTLIAALEETLVVPRTSRGSAWKVLGPVVTIGAVGAVAVAGLVAWLSIPPGGGAVPTQKVAVAVPVPAPLKAPDGGPSRLSDDGRPEERIAAGPFAKGSAAFSDGDFESAAQAFDASASPHERVYSVGLDVARIEFVRALAHLRAHAAGGDDRHLRIGHELLLRTRDNVYAHPEPSGFVSRSKAELVRIHEDRRRLASAGIELDPITRFALVVYDSHGTGTDVFIAETPNEAGTYLCTEPCTVDIPVGQARVMFFRREGYQDAMSIWSPQHHLHLPSVPQGLLLRLPPDDSAQ